MVNDGCCYGIDASGPDGLMVVLRQRGKKLLHRHLEFNPRNIASLTNLIRKGQGKPWICINSTGEVAFALAFTIINNVPDAEVMLMFSHALRHGPPPANGSREGDGSDSKAELLARHAEQLI